MADTNFVAAVQSVANRVSAVWLNAINNLVYQGVNPMFVTSTGSADAQVITLPSSLLTALATGQQFTWKAGFTNTTTTPTLQVVGSASVAAKTMKRMDGAALEVGDIVSGGIYTTTYDGTSFLVSGISTPITTIGSWTPVLTFGTPGTLAVVYSEQGGRYIKQGKLVHLWFGLATSTFTLGTASGSLTVTGAPFAGNAAINSLGSLSWAGITKANYTEIAPIISSSSNIVFSASGSAQARSNVAAADTPTGGPVTLIGTIAYATA